MWKDRFYDKKFEIHFVVQSHKCLNKIVNHFKPIPKLAQDY